MKFKFKTLPYQQKVLENISKVFLGQKFASSDNIYASLFEKSTPSFFDQNVNFFKNKELTIDEQQILSNVKNIQNTNNLKINTQLIKTISSSKEILTFDIDMETGTGKTYVYINSIFELNKQYGWSKFIVIVPSIAIREGAYKSFETTKDHFYQKYKKNCQFFIYDSKNLTKINDFSRGDDINVMIINSQAFNAKGKDARRIRMELDQFKSKRPIDKIASNNPIIIVDEPQKTMGEQTKKSIYEFNPLFILNFSATHKDKHNIIYSLDSIDAMKEYLVKNIACSNINLVNSSGINSYLFLNKIILNGSSKPTCKLTFEIQLNKCVKKVSRILKNGDDIYELSNKMEQYKGFTISNIDKNQNKISFLNGKELRINEVIDSNENQEILSREQIRLTIKEHFKKEKYLFSKNIKCLSLFFIDKVAKYRDYNKQDNKGILANIFEEIYQEEYKNFLEENKNLDEKYKKYLENIKVSQTHNGYFSSDKKGDSKLDNDETNGSNDASAYDLILKNKERLLSFDEPTRFIFSHSALREGWDNPNIFQLCALKDSNNEIGIKQEIGRGLRICVNSNGDRIDLEYLSKNYDEFKKINTLSVIARGSYEEFSSRLQNEYLSDLSNKCIYPTVDNIKQFEITDDGSTEKIGKGSALKIRLWLENNEYLTNDSLNTKFQDDKTNGKLPKIGDEWLDTPNIFSQIVAKLDDMSNNAKVLNKHVTNANVSSFNNIKVKPEKWEDRNWKIFRSLFSKVFYYNIDFKTDEIIKSSIKGINKDLIVNQSYIDIVNSSQINNSDLDNVRNNNSRILNRNTTDSPLPKKLDDLTYKKPYDLVTKIVNSTRLSRKTIIEILKRINKDKFNYFKFNPEDFCKQISKIINNQFIEGWCKLSYHINEFAKNEITPEKFEFDGKDLSDENYIETSKSITSGIKFDSNVEKEFAKELDENSNTFLYAKLPIDSFKIPTPINDYHPDWAIVTKNNNSNIKVEFIKTIIETKGTNDSTQLRKIENFKIESAEKLFKQLFDAEFFYCKCVNFKDFQNFVINNLKQLENKK